MSMSDARYWQMLVDVIREDPGAGQRAAAELLHFAQRDGFTTNDHVLYFAKRIENRQMMIRLVADPPIELLEKWQTLGWSIIPVTNIV